MTRAKEGPGKLSLRHQVREGSHTLTLLGELDLATAPELEATIARLCNDDAREIVLDLRELSLIDSTGWRVIMTGQKLCEHHGCDLALIRVHGQARRLTEPTSLAQRLSFRGRGLGKRVAHPVPV